VLDVDAARLSPYVRHHLRVHGHYTLTLPDLGGRNYRTLCDPEAADEQQQGHRLPGMGSA
jgi:hypothetical protein